MKICLSGIEVLKLKDTGLRPQDPRVPPANCGEHSHLLVKELLDEYLTTIYVLIAHEI